MTDLRKAAEMALEALEDEPKLLVDWLDNLKKAREALRQALTQPEQKKEWIGLTEEEILDSADAFGSFQYGDAQGHKRLEFARAIEAKLKEKNT